MLEDIGYEACKDRHGVMRLDLITAVQDTVNKRMTLIYQCPKCKHVFTQVIDKTRYHILFE